MPDRPMTRDEMVKFEQDIVQHGESRQDVAVPASEADTVAKEDRVPLRPVHDRRSE